MDRIRYPQLLPDLASGLTLSDLNYPYLEQISMVPKVFEFLMFNFTYWSKVLLSVNPTPLCEHDVKVKDLEFLC